MTTKIDLVATEQDFFNLSLIRDTRLLDKKRTQQLEKLKKDLITGFRKRQMGRPRYLMEVSVLKDMKFPTPDAKYWQCILERDIQFQNLMFLAIDFKEKQAEIKEKQAIIKKLEQKLPDPVTEAKIERTKIQIQRLALQLFIMKKQAEEMHREIVEWSNIINDLRPELKYGEDDPEKHMPESFLQRFREQKRLVRDIGGWDMNGAMNIFALYDSAKKYMGR